jgi:plastocyanin
MRLRLGIITLALAAVALSGPNGAQAGGGCHNGVFSDETGTSVEMAGNCFESTVVRVQPGASVTWTNSDAEAHTVSGASNSWGNFGEIQEAESVSYRFDDSGVFPYFCSFHPSMVGAVVVGDGLPVEASNASDGAKAVSAEVPGGDVPPADAPAASSSDDGGSDVPLIAGIAIVAAVAGVGAGWLLKRRTVA